jgi:hypothetical protein
MQKYNIFYPKKGTFEKKYCIFNTKYNIDFKNIKIKFPRKTQKYNIFDIFSMWITHQKMWITFSHLIGLFYKKI